MEVDMLINESGRGDLIVETLGIPLEVSESVCLATNKQQIGYSIG